MALNRWGEPMPVRLTGALGEAWPGAGNIATDPRFVNEAAGDFHLLGISPAIDAGNPLSPADPEYKPKYFGDLRSRDAAYHQGTVWAWLIGPFVTSIPRESLTFTLVAARKALVARP